MENQVMNDNRIRTESNRSTNKSTGEPGHRGWQLGGIIQTLSPEPIRAPVSQSKEETIRPRFVVLAVVAIGLIIFGQLSKDRGANSTFEVWMRETENSYAGYLARIGPDIGEHEVSSRKRRVAEIVLRLNDSFRQHDFATLRLEAINLTILDGDANSPAYRLGVEILGKYQIE